MMQKKNLANENINRAGRLLSKVNGKTALLLLAVILGMFVFIGIIAAIIEPSTDDYTVLDSQITIDNYHPEDGSIKHYDTNYFDAPHKGDVTLITISLPKGDEVPHSYLCFNLYNAVVRIVYNADDYIYPADYALEKLDKEEGVKGYLNTDYFNYAIGMEAQGRLTGHQIIKSPIPEEAWGHTAQIFLVQQDDYTTSRYDDICAVEGSNSFLFPIIMSGSYEFPIFISFFIIGIVMLVSLIVLQLNGLDMRPGIWLALFCLFLSTWVLGYNGEIYLLSHNILITCLSEYVTLYLVPVAIYGYMKYEVFGKHVVQYFKIAQWSFCILFLLAFTLELFVKGQGFVSLLKVLHIMLVVTTVVTLYFVLFGKGPKNDISRKVLKIGFIIAVAFVSIEVLRLYMNKVMVNTSDTVRSITKHSYAPLYASCT